MLPRLQPGPTGTAHRIRQYFRDARNIVQTQIALRWKGVYLPSLYGHYTVNSVCNLRCSYCYVGQSEIFPEGFTNPGLSIDRAKRVVRALRDECIGLRLQGGEPLLFAGITELARYAKRDLGFWHVSIITNGLHLLRRAERWNELLDNLDLVTISIDGTRLTEYPRQMRELLAALPEIATRCRRARASLTLNYTASWDDLAHPERIRTFVDAHRRHFGNVYIMPVRQTGKTPLPLLRNSVALNRQYSVVKESFPDYPETEDVAWYREHCDPKLKIKVDAGGELVYPCENHSYTAGSLETGSIRELWTAQLTPYPNESCVGCGKQRWRSAATRDPRRFVVGAWRMLRGEPPRS